MRKIIEAKLCPGKGRPHSVLPTEGRLERHGKEKSSGSSRDEDKLSMAYSAALSTA